MEVEEKDIRAAYRVADENGRRMLCALFPHASLVDSDADIKERVKTLGDACAELDEISFPYVEHYEKIAVLLDKMHACCAEDIEAFIRLRVITAALNEGSTPEYIRNEVVYCPIIRLKETYEPRRELDWEWVPGNSIVRAMGDYKAMKFEIASGTATTLGVPPTLCYKSEELAKYSAERFKNLWIDYYLRRDH